MLCNYIYIYIESVMSWQKSTPPLNNRRGSCLRLALHWVGWLHSRTHDVAIWVADQRGDVVARKRRNFCGGDLRLQC